MKDNNPVEFENLSRRYIFIILINFNALHYLSYKIMYDNFFLLHTSILSKSNFCKK